MRSFRSMRPPLGAGLILVLSLHAGSAPGQQATSPGDPAGPPGDTIDLVFEREVFTYPTFERRNPFRPLTGEDSGPRFEDLVLLGVTVAADRSRSIALLGERPQGTTQQRTHRLREGEVLGNSRVLEIRAQPDLVVFQIEEFGLFELGTLELRRADPELPPPPTGTQPPPAQPPPVPADTQTVPATPEDALQGEARLAPSIDGATTVHWNPGNGGWS